MHAVEGSFCSATWVQITPLSTASLWEACPQRDQACLLLVLALRAARTALLGQLVAVVQKASLGRCVCSSSRLSNALQLSEMQVVCGGVSRPAV